MTEMYDPGPDLGETDDVLAEHPQIVQRMEGLTDEAKTTHPNWRPR